MKIVQHVGLSLLPAKVVSWRYMRGVRSIGENLKEHSMNSPGPSKLEEPMSEEDEADDNFVVPSEIEDVISFLLDGLRYKCSKVRWSAAKGLGRITSRLPRIIAGEVVSSVSRMFELDSHIILSNYHELFFNIHIFSLVNMHHEENIWRSVVLSGKFHYEGHL